MKHLCFVLFSHGAVAAFVLDKRGYPVIAAVSAGLAIVCFIAFCLAAWSDHTAGAR